MKESETDLAGDPGLVPPPVDGVDEGQWFRLLSHGRRIGALSTQDIVDVLHDVVLDADVIEVVRSTIESCGITVDQTFEVDDSGELRRPFVEAQNHRRTERIVAVGHERRRPSDADGHDAVRMYLYEISRIPLLTAEEEKILGRRIAEGIVAEDEMQRLGDQMQADERRRLQRAARNGRKARDELTQANLRLVVSIAKRYAKVSMPLADAIQSGNIGLMKAVERFDYTKGFKFSTYATWWIKQAISRAIADESRNIRIPTHAIENINRAVRVQRELTQRLQREPTIAEVAEILGERIERVAEYFSLLADTTSLDQPTRDDGDQTFADNLAASDAIDPSDSIEVEDMKEAVRAILLDLPEREQEVMRMRFGLDGHQGATLEEVGHAFNITRERVRQIEVRTLFRLRHVAGGRALRQFVDG